MFMIAPSHFLFFTCCYTCYTFTCAWLRGPALDIAPDVAVLRVFLRLLGLLLRFHWAFLALDCAPAAPDPRLLAPDSFDAWAWFRGSAFALRFLCTLLLRLLALALAPDLDQARNQAQTLALPFALARALALAPALAPDGKSSLGRAFSFYFWFFFRG